MSARLLASIAIIILASNSRAAAQSSTGAAAQSASELSAEEAVMRHKSLMRAHRKRIIETGKNDHAPTPEEYSPELEHYKNRVRPIDRANQANTSHRGGDSANLSTSNQQVELRTDIKLESEKPGPPSPAGTDQFVSKHMHSENTTNQSMATAGSQQPVDFKPYMTDLSRRIKRCWLPPAHRDRTVVAVNFIVLPDGSVANLRITKHGSALADEAARHAILRAAPFAHFPAGVTAGKQIDYEFSHSSQSDQPSFQWGIH